MDPNHILLASILGWPPYHAWHGSASETHRYKIHVQTECGVNCLQDFIPQVPSLNQAGKAKRSISGILPLPGNLLPTNLLGEPGGVKGFPAKALTVSGMENG